MSEVRRRVLACVHRAPTDAGGMQRRGLPQAFGSDGQLDFCQQGAAVHDRQHMCSEVIWLRLPQEPMAGSAKTV